MKIFKAVKTVFCVAMMSATLSSIAYAAEWDKKTVFTFSSPIEIPGVHLHGWAVLPAGTYVFRILDSRSDRHVVQILNQDETTVYATILAVPNFRLKVTDKTVMTFRERPAGEPEALRAWFYPGTNSGEEFVYPKAKALELAKTADAPVLFTAVEIPVEVAEPIRSADDPLVMALERAPILGIKPTGEEVQLAEVVTPVKVEAAAATLPSTATQLPALALFGFLALGAGLALRAFKKRAY